MRRSVHILLMIPLALAGFAMLSFDFSPAPPDGKIHKIVIDAGHGGKDPGTHGLKAKEKDVALSIALELRRILNENMPEVEVEMTRDDDTFVELYRRGAIAGEKEADFFVSIHCNANSNTHAHGTETYVLGMHRDDAKSTVLKENGSIYLEENYEENYSDYDPEQPSSIIIMDMLQEIQLQQSLMLAENVENQFKEKVQRHSRGVKQAGYVVLWKAPTPSILIETGFLTNADEEKFLNSEQGQVYLASAIYRAIKQYNADIE